jgi:hypothetical protein
MNNFETIEVATRLRELFPQGYKEETTLPWRANSMEICQRLDRFHNMFPGYTGEEMVEATRRYVNSFNNARKYMQVLKYFILKQDPATKEWKSRLLDHLENKTLGLHAEVPVDLDFKRMV